MPVPAEERWRNAQDELLSATSEINSVYDQVAQRPNYWGGSRVDRKERQILNALGRLDGSVSSFYGTAIPDLVLQGAQSVNPNFAMTPEAEEMLAALRNNGLTRMDQATRMARTDVRRWGMFVKDYNTKNFPRHNHAKQLDANSVRGIVGVDGRRFRPDTYAALLTRADASKAYNFGVIAAARDEGLKYVRISDGPGCGLLSHDDPQLADGLVMRVEEAMSYPIAHPACQRTFIVDDDTRKRKRSGPARKELKVATAAAVGIVGIAGAAKLLNSDAFRSKLTQFAINTNPNFGKFRDRVMNEYQRAKDLTDEQITAAVREATRDFEAGNVSSIGANVRNVLSIDEIAPRKVVGDSMGDWSDYDMIRRYNAEGISRLDFENSVTSEFMNNVIELTPNINTSYQLPKVFGNNRKISGVVEWGSARFSGNLGRDVSGSFSQDIGGWLKLGALRKGLDSSTITYADLHPGQLFRWRISHVKEGIANNLILNPNGTLRAGFKLDPATGLITPSLRFVPKGPLRISTVINRSEGFLHRGTVIKDKIRVVIPKPVGAMKAMDYDVVRAKVIAKGMPEQPPEGAQRIVRGSKEHPIAYQKNGADVKEYRRALRDVEPKQFLTVDDFAPDAIEDLFYLAPTDANPKTSGMIMRGRIPGGMTIMRDGVAVPRDLYIKNGKFVLDLFEGKGRYNSVSAEVKLLLGRHVRLGARANFNLRPLDIYNWTDVSHLRLDDIIKNYKGDLRKHFKIVSLSAELRALNYSTFEISKLFRIKWEDAMRIVSASDHALFAGMDRQFVSMREALRLRGVADLNNVPFQVRFYADLFRQTGYRKAADIAAELIDRGMDVSYLLADLAWQKFREDPLGFLTASGRTLTAINRAVDIKYGARPNLKVVESSVLNSPTREQYAKILSLSPEEIAEEAGISLREAQELWDRAATGTARLVADADPLTAAKYERMLSAPQAIRRYYGDVTHTQDVSVIFDDDLMIKALGADVDPGAVLAIRADVHALTNMLQDRFPGMADIEWNWNSDRRFAGEESNTIAYYTWAAKMFGGKTNNAIFIPQSTARNWASHDFDLMISTNIESGWFAQYPPNKISVLAHELSHHLHIVGALDKSAAKDINAMIFNNLAALTDDAGKPLLNTAYVKNPEKAGKKAWALVYKKGNANIIANEVSIYGSSMWEELVAEGMAEYLLSPNPRRMAVAIGRAIEEYYA